MEKILNIHIEKLPERVYLATSESIPGLVAQGRTVSETLEIARDVAGKFIESRQERENPMEQVYHYSQSSRTMPEGTLRMILKRGDITPDDVLARK